MLGGPHILSTGTSLFPTFHAGRCEKVSPIDCRRWSDWSCSSPAKATETNRLSIQYMSWNCYKFKTYKMYLYRLFDWTCQVISDQSERGINPESIQNRTATLINICVWLGLTPDATFYANCALGLGTDHGTLELDNPWCKSWHIVPECEQTNFFFWIMYSKCYIFFVYYRYK